MCQTPLSSLEGGLGRVYQTALSRLRLSQLRLQQLRCYYFSWKCALVVMFCNYLPSAPSCAT